MLYIAYGSNMDMDQMAYRCPDAAYVDTVMLDGWRLMFKGSQSGNYATIEREEGCKVPALLWEVSKADERSLDRYEGFPHFYYKEYLDVPGYGKAMVYIMYEERLLGMPTTHYWQVLHDAYVMFKFDETILDEAMDYSWKYRGRANAKTKLKSGRKKMALDKRRLRHGIYCTAEEHLWLLEKLEERRRQLGLPPRMHSMKIKKI